MFSTSSNNYTGHPTTDSDTTNWVEYFPDNHADFYIEALRFLREQKNKWYRQFIDTYQCNLIFRVLPLPRVCSTVALRMLFSLSGWIHPRGRKKK